MDSLKEDKTLGPDGFPTKFYVEFYDVIGEDVMAALEEFHNNTTWCRSLSASFITLIPKKKRSCRVERLQAD